MSNSAVDQYIHHNRKVTVVAALKGNHRAICLCFLGCAKFKPNEPDHCPIAQANYALCVAHGTVQPVTECPEYTPDPIKT